jgi:hypothetical protein
VCDEGIIEVDQKRKMHLCCLEGVRKYSTTHKKSGLFKHLHIEKMIEEEVLYVMFRKDDF